ncbi:MAG: hypothetical protein IJB86_00900 [Clostridia bacterium]|nr:hypothetical protein [Clostridia bacterium]
MYYHASQNPDIKILEPRISNHNTPLIYFSTKRENVLVYLSNAVEKFCKETGFVHDGKWHKWASYGFESDGTLRLDEYYPKATEDTYKGVSGYIYSVENICESGDNINICDAVTTSKPADVTEVEVIEDAYSEILKAEDAGLIKIRRYEDMSEKMLTWIKNTIKNEYAEAESEPDYKHFLKAKFSFLD